ncbi:MAG: hypothetical protein EOM73_16185 [Bacteroidia bacterium]|nr:hypothetical protein [Bacteroidia bacterium]
MNRTNTGIILTKLFSNGNFLDIGTRDRQHRSEIFRFTAQSIVPLWNVFGLTVIVFPVLWMLAGWIPALLATQVDAARILSRE